MKKETVFSRVAVGFEVDTDAFKDNPQLALETALKEGRAYIADGDNYAPKSWNEEVFNKCDIQTDEIEFFLDIHKITTGDDKSE